MEIPGNKRTPDSLYGAGRLHGKIGKVNIMGPEGKKQHIALPAALAVCLLLLLVVGGVYFARYLRQQIYEERTNQLVEITSQVQVNLNHALNIH